MFLTSRIVADFKTKQVKKSHRKMRGGTAKKKRRDEKQPSLKIDKFAQLKKRRNRLFFFLIYDC